MDKRDEEMLEVFSHYLTEEPLGAWRGCYWAFASAGIVVVLIFLAIIWRPV